MTFRGKIHNGQVILDEPAEVPDGTPVEVVVPQSAASDEADVKSLQELLLKFAGVVKDMPSDFARNHDHYIHGTPKR